MKKSKILSVSGLVALPIASLLLFGFAKHPSPPTFNGKPAQQETLTKVQVQQQLNNIGVLVTPFGKFTRVNHPLSNLPANEITSNKSDLVSNPNIKEVILPYGVFVKSSEAGVANFERKWAANHLSSAATSNNSFAGN